MRQYVSHPDCRATAGGATQGSNCEADEMVAEGRGYAREAEPMQQLAHAALVQGDAPLTRNPRLDVHAAPAHNAVHLDIWPHPYPVRDLRLLLARKPARRSATMPVTQTRKADRIVAVPLRWPSSGCAAGTLLASYAQSHKVCRSMPAARAASARL